MRSDVVGKNRTWNLLTSFAQTPIPNNSFCTFYTTIQVTNPDLCRISPSPNFRSTYKPIDAYCSKYLNQTILLL